ncbi:hypothetical protein [uncultured Ottowia sp.]|uniref:hypothetical protein n=1 Tax=uncultured Ottowia sp. TaxID=543067 RepID=UPI002598D517|nr:hypothetical protein [uncultured Ottowia sp.]
MSKALRKMRERLVWRYRLLIVDLRRIQHWKDWRSTCRMQALAQAFSILPF